MHYVQPIELRSNEGGSALQAPATNGDAGAAGHAVLPPVEVILQEENQNIPNIYGNITGEPIMRTAVASAAVAFLAGKAS